MTAVRALSVSMIVAAATWLSSPSALHAQRAASRPVAVPAPLACGVDWKKGDVDPDRFCLELGAALGRPIVRVDDARTVRLGESVQIFSTPTQWLVALLKDGRVRSWMTVSKKVGKGYEAYVIAGAMSALADVEVGETDPCVRVTSRRSNEPRSEIIHPWEELKRCTSRETDVADPWGSPQLRR